MRSGRERILLGCVAALVALGVLVLVVDRPQSRQASRVMSGYTVVIDPGHGGRDNGAIGKSGVLEEPVVLSIGQKLKKLLESEGARVVLTRERDTDLAGEGEGPRKPRDMRRRVEMVREWRADIVVSIHANAMPSPRWSGAQVFYDETRHPGGKMLAEMIQAEITRLVGGTQRKASSRIDHYILKNVDVPAVTVEVGFLSNPREEKLLATDEYQQSLAWAIFTGINRFVAEWLQGAR